jgi:hypothetical protein
MTQYLCVYFAFRSIRPLGQTARGRQNSTFLKLFNIILGEGLGAGFVEGHHIHHYCPSSRIFHASVTLKFNFGPFLPTWRHYLERNFLWKYFTSFDANRPKTSLEFRLFHLGALLCPESPKVQEKFSIFGAKWTNVGRRIHTSPMMYLASLCIVSGRIPWCLPRVKLPGNCVSKSGPKWTTERTSRK